MIFKKFFSNRRNCLIIAVALMISLMVGRLFTLQIVHGEDYKNNYRLKVQRQEIIPATRGSIYDRNGNLLAYNKLANAVTIEDAGSYKNDTERNETINGDLYDVIMALERNGDKVSADFGILMDEDFNYTFKDEGTRQKRFRADIFGRNSINELKYNERTGMDEVNASASEIMTYLCDRRYSISSEYPENIRYKIAIVRYHMGLNTYQKYISTTIAQDISEKSVAYIMENQYRYTGISIEEQSLRVYEDAKCFANIIGYTGTVSSEELEELKKTDDSYTINDIIGKSGIENIMNAELMGKKGYRTVFVDSLGNLLETSDLVNQKSGNDVYLSIDKELTVKTYNLLEQQIASILYSKIINAKEYDNNKVNSRDDILIPVYDVYYALVSNRVIDVNKKAKKTDAETMVYDAFDNKFNEVIESFVSMLNSKESIPYNQLSDELQDYSTYLVKKLKSEKVFLSELIDAEDENQKLWTSEMMPVNDYLRYAIEKGWIDIERLVSGGEYVDTGEIYSALISYSKDLLAKDSAFKRDVYKYAILQDRINIGALLAMLYDQGVLKWDEESRNALLSGQKDYFTFIKDKIKTIEITPGQLGLDPCSGSCVIMDPRSGDLLALVTYPGYDNNRLANNLDSDYYAYLSTNSSSPLYNHATQEKTAPGSTFKMVSATAGLSEKVVDTSTIIKDEGKFLKVSNEPNCWIYPGSTHGDLNITEAIRHSCNYYFYEVGYLLAGGENYRDDAGINKLTEYARKFGLGEKTGIEIDESEPSIANEYPVMAAIGQSNHNFTTIGLARYVSSVASRGDVYNLSILSKVTDKDGNIIKTFGPTPKNNVDVLDGTQWDAITTGMREVVENLNTFNNFPIEVAGKTGTAQQSATRPNHALFVGYAPYVNPEVSVACRISYGYTSANAADLAKKVLADYFGIDLGAINEASNINTNNRITD